MIKISDIYEDNISGRQCLALMAGAYFFSIAVKMIVIHALAGNKFFLWNNDFIITSTDGYFWGAIVQKKLLAMHGFNVMVPDFPHSMLPLAAWALAAFFNTALEPVMFYMPVFVSGLIVIPVIMIGRTHGSSLWGFFAALFLTVCWSFYNRTIPGYFDTDMFSVLFVVIILYFLLAAVRHFDLKYVLGAGLFILWYPVFYQSGGIISQSLVLAFMGYCVIYHTKDEFTWKAILLLAVSQLPGIAAVPAADIPMPLIYSIESIMITGLFLVLRRFKISLPVLITLGIAAAAVYVIFSGPIGYLQGRVSMALDTGVVKGGLKFMSVLGFINEAVPARPLDAAAFSAGSLIGLFLAGAGYAVLIIKRPSFLIAIPLIGVGVFSMWGGKRFLIFAVPVISISLVYGLVIIFINILKKKVFQWTAVAAAVVLLMAPSLYNIIKTTYAPVYKSYEVSIMDRLKKIASPKDYVITWWDYGNGIWYYSGLNTLISPSRFSRDLYTVSEILSSDSPRVAANLGRLSVEKFTELFSANPPADGAGYRSAIEYLLQGGKPHQADPAAFLGTLRYPDYDLPGKTRDVYLFMPAQMLYIYETVLHFSNIDLLTGKRLRDYRYLCLNVYNETRDEYVLPTGLRVGKNESYFKNRDGKAVDFQSYTILRYNKDGVLDITEKKLNPKSGHHLIFHETYRIFILLNDPVFRSNFIQMFLFDRYDKNLFEPVISEPAAKVFRLMK